jgi:drug/metabolite transporter (DMT)-like permease
MAAISNATISFWTVPIAAIRLGETSTRQRFIGLALGILGVTLLVGWSPLASGIDTLLAVLALIGAALGHGLAANLTKTKLQGASPVGMVTGALLIPSVTLVPFTPFYPILVARIPPRSPACWC